MSQPPNETDLLVAKLMAMEVMLLTLVRPVADKPKFWEDLDGVAQVFENNLSQSPELVQRRWGAVRHFLDEWRAALSPPQG
ncbi:hypothetical protein [Luteimonas sp. A478]